MKRSKFSLSHTKLLSCDMGELVPISIQEVLPGDTMQKATSLLVRVTPLLAPVMHPVHVRIHDWFVPFRLIWDDFESFITGGPDGMDASTFPTIAHNNAEGQLGDYFGLPPGVSTETSALPFRAYNLIYNEFYRDQDLQTPLVISKASGLDTTTDDYLVSVCWEKDYFTSARPWVQKGPDVTIPLGTEAPVVPDTFGTSGPLLQSGINSGTIKSSGVGVLSVNGGSMVSTDPLLWAQNTGLVADLSTATAVGINTIREAFALQRMEEARARYGSRYVEYLRYLGVKSSDARLQRPEYLGGGRQTIQFSEVLQTGVDAEDAGVGNLAGHGIGAARSRRWRRFFEEHGFVISLMSVKPKTIYAQGTPRMFNRRLKEDFFQRELQHIGQQAIENREIYAAGPAPYGTFGYQDRYDEYRRQESSVAGEFRSTLDFWHYARLFASAPALNGDFVRSYPTKRVYAENSQDALWVMANHSVQARRMVAASGKSFIF